MSVVSLTSGFVNVQFANVLRWFANMFSLILKAHCQDSKLNLFKKLEKLKFGNFDPLRMITAYFTLTAPRNIITKYINSQHLVS